MGEGGGSKFIKKCPYSHNNNTALIKQFKKKKKNFWPIRRSKLIKIEEFLFRQNPFSAILRLKKEKKEVPMATKLEGGGGRGVRP